MCACVKVVAEMSPDGREVSLHRSAGTYTCFSLLSAFRLFTRTAVALCNHIYTSAGVFQALAYADLTEEDALTFLVYGTALGPMSPPRPKPMRISQREISWRSWLWNCM